MFPNLKVSLAPLILRGGLAAIFLYHGFLKISYHGGTGWSDTLETWVQLTVAWGEAIGGLLLVVGLLSRLAAVWFTFIMMCAIVNVTGQREFVHIGQYFDRHFHEGSYRWEVGYEYNFAIIVMSCVLIILGSGQWSVDYLIFGAGRTAKEPAPAVGPGH